MPLKYKIGDKVRVGDHWFDGDESDGTGVSFVHEMENYRGKIVTIKDIYSENRKIYDIEEDDQQFIWAEEFFEPANQVFITDNVVLLRNGQVRLVYQDALYLPNGTCIETENYTGRKHNFDENFDIVEVRRRSTSNYKFDMSGELIQEEE